MDASYEQGRVAYLQGKSITDNPYSPYSERFDLWSKGWHTELDIALEACPLDAED